MNGIIEKVQSHLRFALDQDPYITIGKPKPRKPENKKIGFYSVAQIRGSMGYEVKSFSQLVTCISELAYRNPRYNLFYRGQNKDIKDKLEKTVLYPRLFRPPGNKKYVTKKYLDEKRETLNKIRRILYKNRKEIYCHERLSSYKEFYYALIQHYEIERTPFIDVTQSLRVAATFALRDYDTGTNLKEGYVLVFGLPYPHGSISHFIDEEMVIVKLQNVSPPSALRPQYQEGYLVGKLPINFKKSGGDNLATRLIGKYFLNNSNGNFWMKGFARVPEEVLFPKEDNFKKQLEKLVKEIK